MALDGKTLKVCNCNRTMALDAKALASALELGAPVAIHSELCRKEVASFTSALKDGECVVACTQESPLFSELATRAGSSAQLHFVNIRETAGWSAEGKGAMPKIAALLALADIAEPEPVPGVSYASGGNLLIDTAPDLRQQLLREDIGLVHAVLYTHEHADHIFGLDDLRLMQFYLGGPVPLFCEEPVEQRIRKSYDYAFNTSTDLHRGAVPQIVFRRITTEPFEVLGTRVTPIRMRHGPRFDVLGFRFGKVAYCTDVNAIPKNSMTSLTGLDTLVLDALRPKSHTTHFSLAEAVEIARQLQPRQTYFTHMSHELEHDATNAQLPAGMELAYDGLRIPLV